MIHLQFLQEKRDDGFSWSQWRDSLRDGSERSVMNRAVSSHRLIQWRLECVIEMYSWGLCKCAIHMNQVTNRAQSHTRRHTHTQISNHRRVTSRASNLSYVTQRGFPMRTDVIALWIRWKCVTSARSDRSTCFYRQFISLEIVSAQISVFFLKCNGNNWENNSKLR